MDRVHFSELESARFHMNVHRGTTDDFEPQEVINYLLEHYADILILRLPSSGKPSHYKLNDLGFEFIHADSLVYYVADLDTVEVKEQRHVLEYEVITEKNNQAVDNTVAVIFEGYQNHYLSNPYLAGAKILEGYIEWAKSYANNGEDKISWYVKKEGEIVGFSACSFNKSTGNCEGVLLGVMPAYSGRGIYKDMIRFTLQYFKEQGFKRMLISTQLQNYTVQKVWTREGFYLFNSYETYHINAMLSFNGADKQHRELIIAEDMFPGGIVSQAVLSYAGGGATILSDRRFFMTSVYQSKEYTLEISTLKNNHEGRMLVLVKVMDAGSKICFLSYINLLKDELFNSIQ